MTATVKLLGIRHHGPGSARSVARALDALQPTAVLVELPADCEASLTWVGNEHLVPPVALLGYVVDHPQRAAFLPFAEFSPEWQAFMWAKQHHVVVRAMDLPLQQTLAGGDSDGDELQLARATAGDITDPLAALAEAAGDPDPERWWDDVIEHRGDGAPAFDSVAMAMTAVRGGRDASTLREAQREAHMRQVLRQAIADGHERIAVVCGAWHLPALAEPLPPATTDAQTLRGLPKVKVGLCWVPWTHRRLAAASGYGAGVRSPGWYAHVFINPGELGITRWFVGAARLLRDRGMSASPDDLIAATRAATTLAALRNRPRAGLAEVLDAADTVMAGATGMALIERELIVGDAIGQVPDDAPQVPLARDLAAQQRRVRLKPAATAQTVELDVRAPNGRARSVLLHRLRALGVHWGSVEEGRGSSGTFRETWRLQWEPELTIRVIELSAHGTTVQAAATHRLLERAVAFDALADLVGVLDTALLAELPEVVAPVVARVEAQAAHDPDIVQVIDTLGPLARALRYGDVRGTDASALRAVFDGLVVRVLAGTMMACRSLDDDGAAAMVERLAGVQAALALVDHPARRAEWPAVLTVVAERSDVHGLVQGRATRLLHDGGAWNRALVGARLSRALSVGTTPAVGAAFVEGFLAGSGTVLVHDAELLGVIDGWVSSLAPDAFIATAPLLRRTFGAFEPGERRQLGLLIADEAAPTWSGFGSDVDGQRAAAALTTVRLLLGVPLGLPEAMRDEPLGSAHLSSPEPEALRVSDPERMRRWRMVLGGTDADDNAGARADAGVTTVQLDGNDARIDAALAAVYDTKPGRRGGGGRAGGLGSSAPSVARWLGDIRRYFPSSVVQVLQRDAIDRLNLRQLLLEPEMLRAVEPDMHLVTLLVELNKLLPDTTRATARQVVAQVVEQIEQRLASRTKQAIHGALARSQRSRRPRLSDIDWGHTIHANLRHYLPEQRAVVPERLIGYGRRQRSLSRDVIVAIDQSGSMADSVVYAAVFGAVLASMPALRTSVIAFDSAVADLTPLLHDPVDVLFGVQLGGGTDIAQAIGYCQQLVTRPADTVLVLVSDLFEGGNAGLLNDRVASLCRAGVTVVVLLALSDEGAPAYDHAQAAVFAELGVPSLACTPDAFPDLLAAALEHRDVGRWANEHGLHTAVGVKPPGVVTRGPS